ncbi:MAG: VWA domain-containing protein [Propionibacteriaceae bacterium]|nr:VWA domain-containing protein [Propionibacteriaceae bacterium]
MPFRFRPFLVALGAMLCVLLAACTALPRPAWPGQAETSSNPGDHAGETDAPAGTSPTQAPSPALPVILVIDSSGSMAAPDMGGGTTRLAAAQQAAKDFVAGLPAGTEVALVTYGDTAPEDAPLSPETCADVTIRRPLGAVTPEYGADIDHLAPRGWTPTSAALSKAAEAAPDGPAQIVLITDGEDSCAPPDPCETAAALADRGLVVSAIGVRASSAQLECIARRGGGTYVTADSAAQLTRRITAFEDPAEAATLLSPRGLSQIVPGQQAADIRQRHPDFPVVPAVQTGTRVQVVWRACLFAFDELGVLREISLRDGATIDGLTVGSKSAELALLGAPVAATALPDGGESRVYVADAAAGLGWYVEIKAELITRIVLCGACLPQQNASAWVPCPGAQWALEGEDYAGRLVVAMCEDGLGTYADGKKLGSLTVTERYPFGAMAAADGHQVVIEDVRTDYVIVFMAGPSATVTRQLLVTRRYPDTTCAVTPQMRAAIAAAGLPSSGEMQAICIDNWARVTTDELGDSTFLIRFTGDRWEFYGGFPTHICRSKFRADGGPEALARPFREC